MRFVSYRIKMKGNDRLNSSASRQGSEAGCAGLLSERWDIDARLMYSSGYEGIMKDNWGRR